ncbi:MAG: hypothetical protein NZ899_10145 [Thermoguttaceae bacterium]|nr:hypothetical protein [Thermoguttaceae bacterium]MDW8078046.1 hypothetical protein [Thermoguttaceae bacterium]
MAIDFQQLQSLMAKAGFSSFADPEKQLLVCLCVGWTDVLTCLLIRLAEDGEAVEFCVPRIASVPPETPHREKVFKAVLEHNHLTKIGRACFDPSQNEIYVDWVHAIEDGHFTAKQLQRCVIMLIDLAGQISRRVNHILATGEDLPPERLGVRGLLRSLAEFAAKSPRVRPAIRELLRELAEAEGGPSEYRAILERYRELLHLDDTEEDGK